ncbi:acyl-CoA dehydrogenase family protein [Rhodococcoides yunnanense]|uniref:Acyl-CoA dehydrogenase family protein n=1 Tax=Rhodococcoides yunnanense TaxID=278209 RepID=A0ABU4BKJ7_9NOCA|nr:acyl-CoA dehydrogenase family protein [Rhodococcus yunnanensis]MDV6264705.1 acyl-CoA dehydrogenase family protein [Rhodococcus yunnanensis]
MTIATPPPVSMVEDSIARDVRASLRALLDSRCTPSFRLEFVSGQADFDDALWSAISRDLGLAGLLIPEDLGGAGASVRESAAVLSELGRALAPVPYLSSAVIATTALVHCARSGSSGAAEVVAKLAGGAIAALAIPATQSSDDVAQPTVQATEASDESVTLSGYVSHVVGVAGAVAFVVPALRGHERVLTLVTADTSSVTATRRTGIDDTRPTSDLVFSGVSATVIATGQTADHAVSHALATGAALLASEQVGICEWALSEATGYLTVRHQFGRPIGSYQSLRHRAAQMWIDINNARAAAIYAASTLADSAPDRAVASAIAQSYCSGVALYVVEEALQMHGGIGFTWDHPLHLYLKRAFADTVLLGDAETHKRTLARLVALAEPGVGLDAS